MRVVDRVTTLPLVGTEGSLLDLRTALVEFEPPAGAVITTQLLVAAGTPAAVLDRVRAAGVPLTDPRSLAGPSTTCAPTPSAWACGCSWWSAPPPC